MRLRLAAPSGFTLMEVMISLALVSGLLVTLLYTLTHHLGVAEKHAAMTVATYLAKGKALCVGLLTLNAAGQAQVYTCVAPDGSRMFSDQKCGPDAKLVPGMGKHLRGSSSRRSPPRPPKPPKAPAELEQLIQQCDVGDMKACSEWTLGGGPKLLRERERKAELDCESGSLAACEERYCRTLVDEDCRARVLRTAKLAGEGSYLREGSVPQRDGRTAYRIRCIPPQVREPRDITVHCAREAGPQRCYVTDTRQRYAKLAQAAASHCLAPPVSNP